MDALPPALFERFERSFRALGATHTRAASVLARCYAEPHRAYHDLEHIAECLAWLDVARGQAERPDELALALWFHDAVYVPLAPDNEAKSARLFADLASEAGVPDACVGRISLLILATTTHAGEAGDALLMSDIDLAILGAPPHRYARYERAIRREFAEVDEERYRLGRTCVLRGFLGRLAIYRTALFAARLEAQARHNLGAALASLES